MPTPALSRRPDTPGLTDAPGLTLRVCEHPTPDGPALPAREMTLRADLSVDAFYACLAAEFGTQPGAGRLRSAGLELPADDAATGDDGLRLCDLAARPGDTFCWGSSDRRVFRVEVLRTAPAATPTTPDPLAGNRIDLATAGAFPQLAQVFRSCPCECGGPPGPDSWVVQRAVRGPSVEHLAADLDDNPLVRSALDLAERAEDGRTAVDLVRALQQVEGASGDPDVPPPFAVARAAQAAGLVVTDSLGLLRRTGAVDELRTGAAERRLDLWAALVSGYWRALVEMVSDGDDAARRVATDLAGPSVLAFHANDHVDLGEIPSITYLDHPELVDDDVLAASRTAAGLVGSWWAACGCAVRHEPAGGAFGDGRPGPRRVPRRRTDRPGRGTWTTTPLGAWTVGRMLAGHGAEVHVPGSLRDLPAGGLLDRLAKTMDADRGWEFAEWLEARSDRAHDACRELFLAASGPEDDRPRRRMVLAAVGCTADPVTLAVFDAVAAEFVDDPWLAVHLRQVKALREGGDVSLADAVWTFVDRLAGLPSFRGDPGHADAPALLTSVLLNPRNVGTVLDLRHPRRTEVFAQLWAGIPPHARGRLDGRVRRLLERAAAGRDEVVTRAATRAQRSARKARRRRRRR